MASYGKLGPKRGAKLRCFGLFKVARRRAMALRVVLHLTPGHNKLFNLNEAPQKVNMDASTGVKQKE